MYPITSLFAGLFTLYYVRLAFEVIRLRKSEKVSLGAGGVADLEKAIRVHGNFSEYAPLGLILMGLLESHGARPVFLLVLGMLFAAGRVLHAQGLKHTHLKQRVRGMVLTFGSLVTLAIVNIVYAVRVWFS